MYKQIIVDADLCIKLGGSEKYPFLYNILPLISEEILIHSYTQKEEVLSPPSAVRQLNELIAESKIVVVSENMLSIQERAIYDMTYRKLSKIMLDPMKPHKNRGEVSSLSYAKATHIPIFATDEKDLQTIINKQLNTGIDDITCLRIEDIARSAKEKEFNIPRKIAKALWLVSGKKKEVFDNLIWPVEDTLN